MKRFFRYFSYGALLGAIVASYLAPRAIGWYFQPPVEMGVNCRLAAEYAMNRLQWAHILGAGVGALIGIFLTIAFRKRPNLEPGMPAATFGGDDLPHDPKF